MEGLTLLQQEFYLLLFTTGVKFLFFIFCPHSTACGILVPPPGIEPMPLAMKMWSLNHWTTREFPRVNILIDKSTFSFLGSHIHFEGDDINNIMQNDRGELPGNVFTFLCSKTLNCSSVLLKKFTQKTFGYQ